MRSLGQSPFSFSVGVLILQEKWSLKKLERKSSFVEKKAANQTSARAEGQSVGDEQALCS